MRVVHECPACSKKRLTGPGSFVEVPAPDKENPHDMRPPVGIVSVDKDGLEYTAAQLKELANEIHEKITGTSQEPLNNQAVNDKQVQGFFESWEGNLNKLQKNFEQAQEWAEYTICKLRYGNLFDTCSISYGTSHYLYSSDWLLEFYNSARDKGADDNILDGWLWNYYEAKYRNNPEQLRRAIIMIALDPFRHSTKTKVAEMYRSFEVNYEDYFLKQNLSTLISRFEREYMDIVLFMDGSEFRSKVDAIRKKLLSYIVKPVQPKPEPKPVLN
jgi:hypothetical protein